MIQITKISGVGCEILAAVRRNSAQSAYNHNVKQAQKYLKECKQSGCAAMVAYAERELAKIQLGDY